MPQFQFTALIEQDEDGRVLALCPALPGCYTEGATEPEAIELIEDAARLHVQDRLERGEPIVRDAAVAQVRVEV